ncbi:MAG: integrase core domain-containing protein [Nitrospirota bacterium]
MPRPVPRNLIWGLDLMVKTDTQGRQHLVLAILDHASRACLRLQRLPDKSALTLLRHVIETCRRYSAPRWLRTDNETIFASRRFRVTLRLLGIRSQRTDPGCPWQNGRVERFIGTVKAMLSQGTVGNADHLDHALRHVRTCYNHLRPHQHLQGRTPAEVWAGLDVFANTPHDSVGTSYGSARANGVLPWWPRGAG